MADLNEMHQLVREYREAQDALKAAAEVLDAHIAHRTMPTAEEVQIEASARARLVAARQRLYKD